MEGTKRRTRKIGVVVSISISVALLHFVTGENYQGPFPVFVNGYMIDVLLPFSLYFLLCLTQASILRSWLVKAILVFAVGLVVETAQFYGFPILGQTFDPLDYLMYGLGVLMAVVLDTLLFPRLFVFWASQTEGAP